MKIPRLELFFYKFIGNIIITEESLITKNFRMNNMGVRYFVRLHFANF